MQMRWFYTFYGGMVEVIIRAILFHVVIYGALFSSIIIYLPCVLFLFPW